MSFVRRRWAVLLAAAALAAIAGGTAIAQSGRGAEPHDTAEDQAEGPDVPISDASDLETASQVALEHTGGGRVTGTEVGDEESYYEIEVTLDDGRQVDVQLDEDFKVVGDEADEHDAG